MYGIKLLLLKQQSCSTPGDAERSNWTFAGKLLTYSMTPLRSDCLLNVTVCTALRSTLAGVINMWTASNPSRETQDTLEVDDSLSSPNTQDYTNVLLLASGVNELNFKVRCRRGIAHKQAYPLILLSLLLNLHLCNTKLFTDITLCTFSFSGWQRYIFLSEKTESVTLSPSNIAVKLKGSEVCSESVKVTRTDGMRRISYWSEGINKVISLSEEIILSEWVWPFEGMKRNDEN